MRVILTLALAAAAFVPEIALAQATSPPAAQLEAMSRLAHWVGEWEGSGWAMTGRDQRAEFTTHESVKPRIQGSVLLVEGIGKSRSAGGTEAVTHEALGTISFDPSTGQYRFRTYDLSGTPRDEEFRLTDTGAVWGFRVEERNADLRFTITIEGDTWHEIGEVSLDGGTRWFRILDMTLTRAERTGL